MWKWCRFFRRALSRGGGGRIRNQGYPLRHRLADRRHGLAPKVTEELLCTVGRSAADWSRSPYGPGRSEGVRRIGVSSLGCGNRTDSQFPGWFLRTGRSGTRVSHSGLSEGTTIPDRHGREPHPPSLICTARRSTLRHLRYLRHSPNPFLQFLALGSTGGLRNLGVGGLSEVPEVP
jgi:hypothetical protein